MTCSNAGDSRAVLGRCVDSNWVHHDLSRDHKPNDPDEKERIIRNKGRIEPFKDENGEFVGPYRVWLLNDEIPGLAMSRSFGDQVAASVGVTCDPEISEWNFTKDDCFMMLASDGVWEFITSEEAVNIVKEYYLKNDINGAGESLMREAVERWKRVKQINLGRSCHR